MQVVLLSFFILLSTIVSGCSSKQETLKKEMLFGSKDYIESYVSRVPSKWFEGPQRFQLMNDDNKLAAHRFWDVKPEINPLKKTLNFVVTTPEGSPSEYNLDITSGQLYFSRNYCAQQDIWRNYPEEIKRPPFTVGIIPRVLDQTARPQKIIVFGEGEYYSKHFKSNYFDARIIGGYVEQECPVGLCKKNNEWKSRLVLVGVQRNNKKYEGVVNIEDLQKVVNWDYVKAFIHNGNGINLVATTEYPAFRLGSLIGASQALHFLEKNSKVFTSKELLKLKRSCYRLYDYIWAKLKKDQKQEIKTKDSANSSAELKTNRRVYRKKEKKKTAPKIKQFHEKFVDIYKNYGPQFQTCSKYVYPTNIQYESKRHWTFAYLMSFIKLYELGYYYHCGGKSWQLNAVLANNKLAVPIEEQLVNCSEHDIDFAFKYAVQMLSNLNLKNRKSFRYVDYDRGTFGTHNKLYSWVKSQDRVLSCKNKDNLSKEKVTFLTFPKDIRWRDIKNLKN